MRRGAPLAAAPAIYSMKACRAQGHVYGRVYTREWGAMEKPDTREWSGTVRETDASGPHHTSEAPAVPRILHCLPHPSPRALGLGFEGGARGGRRGGGGAGCWGEAPPERRRGDPVGGRGCRRAAAPLRRRSAPLACPQKAQAGRDRCTAARHGWAGSTVLSPALAPRSRLTARYLSRLFTKHHERGCLPRPAGAIGEKLFYRYAFTHR